MDLITLMVDGQTSAQTVYVPAPVRCVVNEMKVAIGSSVGSGKAFIVSNGSTAQATATTSGTPTAGDTYDATVSAHTIFEAGDAMKVTIPALAAAGPVVMTIRIDPFLAGVTGA